VFMLAPLSLVFFIISRSTRCRRKLRDDCFFHLMRLCSDSLSTLFHSTTAPDPRVFFILGRDPSERSHWGYTHPPAPRPVGMSARFPCSWRDSAL